MTCADFEILLCDYVDGTLDAARRSELEAHQRECSVCAELARDVAGAVAFLERVPEVEPPPELLAKIAFQIPTESAAKSGILQARAQNRAQDGTLASAWAGNLFLGRTFTFSKQFEDKIRALGTAEVSAALKKHVDPSKVTVVTAGDFSKVKP